ncbi:MAG: hypothetical protein QY327_04720 [Fimbriimonadaceae bacterium]|nr:MAG: hypothetical protein QY327_04720 [Fimbriimonadaceae bacterium]
MSSPYWNLLGRAITVPIVFWMLTATNQASLDQARSPKSEQQVALEAEIRRADALSVVGKTREAEKILENLTKEHNGPVLRKILLGGQDFTLCYWAAFTLGILHSSKDFRALLDASSSHDLLVRKCAFIGLAEHSRKGLSAEEKGALRSRIELVVESRDWQLASGAIRVLDKFAERQDSSILESMLVNLSPRNDGWSLAARILGRVDGAKAKSTKDEKLRQLEEDIEIVKRFL